MRSERDDLFFCPACVSQVGQFEAGPRERPNARCPHCGSMERHRVLAMLLQSLAAYIATCGGVLDVAPNRATTRVVERIGTRRYVQLDFDPAADGRSVDVQASLESLPFPDRSFDVIICYHVLEHVERDNVAIAELARVLTDGGFALVQVPWRPNSATDEDPTASPSERVRRFGQADHVRFYGRDFEERLCRNGLSGTRFLPGDLMSADMTSALSVLPTEPVWFLRKQRGEDCNDAHALFALEHVGAEAAPHPLGVPRRSGGRHLGAGSRDRDLAVVMAELQDRLTVLERRGPTERPGHCRPLASLRSRILRGRSALRRLARRHRPARQRKPKR